MDYLSSVMSERAHGDPFDLEDPTRRRKLERNSQKTQGEEAGKVAETVKSAPGPKILLRATVADASVEQEREVVRSEARAPANRSRRARADRHHPRGSSRAAMSLPGWHGIISVSTAIVGLFDARRAGARDRARVGLRRTEGSPPKIRLDRPRDAMHIGCTSITVVGRAEGAVIDAVNACRGPS